MGNADDILLFNIFKVGVGILRWTRKFGVRRLVAVLGI